MLTHRQWRVHGSREPDRQQQPESLARAQDPSRFNADGREQPLDIAIAGEIIVGAAGSGQMVMLEEAVVRASDLALGVFSVRAVSPSS